MNEAEQEKTPAQGIWCGKMCLELSAPTREPISASCSKKPPKWPANKPPLFLSLKTDGLQPDALPIWEDNGALRGEYLMHSFGVCPKDENASHLSQILEASPHPKYSLSAKACLGILNRAEKRGKQLPEILKLALIQQAQRGGAYCIQGNCIDRADTAGCNGKGWTEGVSYTLNTIDRPAVLPFVPSLPQGDVVAFEPGSCSRVDGHIWQDGKAPALRAQSGDNQPAIALESHPADSRVKIAEDGIVQTLNARMGTGGGMFPSLCVRSPVLEHSNAGATDVYPAGNKLQGSTGCNNGGTKVMIMFENYQFANWRPGCGTLKASGGDYGGARKT